MSKIRKLDLVKNPEAFRNYLETKNPRSRRMLEVYSELTEGMEIDFGYDDEETYFYLSKAPQEQDVSGISKRELFLTASKRSGAWGKVEIDTGYFRLTEKGEVCPSQIALNLGYSLDDWQYHGIEGLKDLLSEICKAIEIYDKVFPHRGKPKKENKEY